VQRYSFSPESKGFYKKMVVFIYPRSPLSYNVNKSSVIPTLFADSFDIFAIQILT